MNTPRSDARPPQPQPAAASPQPDDAAPPPQDPRPSDPAPAPAPGQRSLLALAWPIFIEMSLHFATLIINMMMVGMVSVEAVAELTVGNQVYDLALTMFSFINIGVCVVCAQALGAGNQRLVRRLLHQGLGLNVISGLSMTALIYLLSTAIVTLMQVPEEIADSSENYLRILSLCFLPQALWLYASSALRAYRFTRQAMYISVMINAITVFFNSLFLFGLLGMPVLGVEGVAVSTIIGRIIGAAVSTMTVMRLTGVRLHARFIFTFRRQVLQAVLGIGLPGASEHLAWQLQYMLMTSVAATLGAIELATHGIYFQVCLISMLFAISVAMGTEILIAGYVGAQQLEQAYRQLMRSVRIGLAATLAIAATVPLGTGQLLVSLFTDHAGVLAAAAPLFLLTTVMEPGRILNIIIINSLRAAGDTRFPLLMAVISMWGVSVPIGMFLALHTGLGLLGIWIGFCCDEWVRGIAMLLRWRSRVWMSRARELHARHLA